MRGLQREPRAGGPRRRRRAPLRVAPPELEALERDWQLVTESNAGLKSMVAAQLALAAQLDEMPAC